MAKIEEERAEYKKQLENQQKHSNSHIEEQAALKTTPQLRNINQDDSLSGMVKYPFKDGKNTIGKNSKETNMDMTL